MPLLEPATPASQAWPSGLGGGKTRRLHCLRTTAPNRPDICSAADHGPSSCPLHLVVAAASKSGPATSPPAMAASWPPSRWDPRDVQGARRLRQSRLCAGCSAVRCPSSSHAACPRRRGKPCFGGLPESPATSPSSPRNFPTSPPRVWCGRGPGRWRDLRRSQGMERSSKAHRSPRRTQRRLLLGTAPGAQVPRGLRWASGLRAPSPCPAAMG
mmetsp:Transcript_16606/g.39439  ORF Transcript_16606/g.39439 Transcript_16606/m.39439 type:complete len:213 (+) Transcript_16606:120-758(+)